jgi:N-acetyl-gamma-glutamyl-phosphate reductase
MIRAAVVGGTGYTGVELLRLLVNHPETSLDVITSRGEAGKRVADLFPNLRRTVEICYSEPNPETLSACDVVFFATPNGFAMTLAPYLLSKGTRVIDLAADFRLKNADEWQQWYGTPHVCPDLLPEAVYGLPELNREAIKNARLVANPGCYPTAVTLGFLPLLEADCVWSESLIADAKSGISGAGRKGAVETSLCESSETVRAYAVAGHRHLPEILQSLRGFSSRPVGLTFVPHLMPMIRGIHATLYARLRKSDLNLQEVFEARFQEEPFVDVLAPGSHPETRSVRGANFCRLAWHRPQNGEVVVVLSVIDNLGKGAAGQAIQNMNIMFGLDEQKGLDQVALLP